MTEAFLQIDRVHEPARYKSCTGVRLWYPVAVRSEKLTPSAKTKYGPKGVGASLGLSFVQASLQRNLIFQVEYLALLFLPCLPIGRTVP